MNVLSKIEPLLLQAQKPAQYIGGEMGSVIKSGRMWMSALPFAFRIPMRSECLIWA